MLQFALLTPSERSHFISLLQKFSALILPLNEEQVQHKVYYILIPTSPSLRPQNYHKRGSIDRVMVAYPIRSRN